MEEPNFGSGRLSNNNSFSEKGSKETSSFLPSISRTIDHTEAREKIEIEWNKKNEIVRKITEPIKIQQHFPRNVSISMLDASRPRRASK